MSFFSILFLLQNSTNCTKMLKFATFTSDIELPFYTSLASHKINHDKLDDSARKLLGLYEIRPTDTPEASCRLQVHGNALTNDAFDFQHVSTFRLLTDPSCPGYQRVTVGPKE